MMKKFVFKSKWNIAILALLGVSLITAGVFASASININSNGSINLGAGKAEVMACKDAATVSTHQEYNPDPGHNRYELTSISIDGINLDNCVGKTLKMTLDYEICSNGTDCSQVIPAPSTSWVIASGGVHTLTWNNTNGSGDIATAKLDPIDTANVGTAHIAISEE
jgi:hypothetical protein